MAQGNAESIRAGILKTHGSRTNDTSGKAMGKPADSNAAVQAPVSSSSPVYSGEIGSASDLIELDRNAILKGIIFSEILGKPKSKRSW